MHSILNAYLRTFKIVGFKLKHYQALLLEKKKNYQSHLRINARKTHQIASIPHQYLIILNPIAIRNVKRYRFAGHTTENNFCKK